MNSPYGQNLCGWSTRAVHDYAGGRRLQRENARGEGRPADLTSAVGQITDLDNENKLFGMRLVWGIVTDAPRDHGPGESGTQPAGSPTRCFRLLHVVAPDCIRDLFSKRTRISVDSMDEQRAASALQIRGTNQSYGRRSPGSAAAPGHWRASVADHRRRGADYLDPHRNSIVIQDIATQGTRDRLQRVGDSREMAETGPDYHDARCAAIRRVSLTVRASRST